MSCTADEECKIKNGIHKCYPTSEGICHASGDPHYTSFDGTRYDFQGTCTYTLSKTCKTKGTNLDTFSVNVENVEWNRKSLARSVSVARLVTVEVGGFTFILKYKTSGVLVRNYTYFKRVETYDLNTNGATSLSLNERSVSISAILLGQRSFQLPPFES